MGAHYFIHITFTTSKHHYTLTDQVHSQCLISVKVLQAPVNVNELLFYAWTNSVIVHDRLCQTALVTLSNKTIKFCQEKYHNLLVYYQPLPLWSWALNFLLLYSTSLRNIGNHGSPEFHFLCNYLSQKTCSVIQLYQLVILFSCSTCI